jgi:hypothetical protein
MKYLITESKMNSSIERFLRSSFSEVVDVKFSRVGVWLASDDREIERTKIHVLIDPQGILKGNFNVSKGHFIGYDLKKEIWQTVNSMFNLNMEEYGSDWDIEFFVLGIY